MGTPIKILVQTTIPTTRDDWSVERFSLLTEYLRSVADKDGRPAFDVTTRDRESDNAGNDPVLSTLDSSDFDQLWLFAVDAGDGLTESDCAGITRFRKRGGGILATRDHQDLGSSICTLGGVGSAHFFHTRNPDPDETRRTRDDRDTAGISWPNYNSGRNGDYQRIHVVAPAHPLFNDPASPSGVIEFFPAHPHEGGVGVPPGEDHARVVATGTSTATGRPFNLTVALESAVDENGNTLGRGVAESSFHHFADYNWDIARGCPSFVEEAPGDEVARNPSKLKDVKTYVRNAAYWLSNASQ
jgi:hypothetical protein